MSEKWTHIESTPLEGQKVDSCVRVWMYTHTQKKHD